MSTYMFLWRNKKNINTFGLKKSILSRAMHKYLEVTKNGGDIGVLLSEPQLEECTQRQLRSTCRSGPGCSKLTMSLTYH